MLQKLERNTNLILILALFFSLFACKGNQENTAKPKLRLENVRKTTHLINPSGDTIRTGTPIKISFKKLHPDSFLLPKRVPLKSDPLVLPVHANVFQAGQPEVVNLPSVPTTIVPGKKNIPLPREIEVEVRKFPAFQPKPKASFPRKINYDAIIDIQILDVEQGLGSSYNRSIFQDSKGYFWFGASNGVSRYDGNSFLHYTTEEGLSNNNVRAIFEDHKGNIWFGTQNGVVCYDGQYFIQYYRKTLKERGTVNAIYEDSKKNLWFGTSNSLFKFDGKKLIQYTEKEGLINNDIICLLEDHKGRLWIGTDNGLCAFEPNNLAGQFTYYFFNELGKTHVSSLQLDPQNRLWIGSYKGLISMDLNKSEENALRYGPRQGLISGRIRSLLADKRGHLWIGTDFGVMDFNKKTLTHFTSEEGLSHDRIRTIIEDQDGNIWFGTGGGGVNRLNPYNFTYFNETKKIRAGDFTYVSEDKKGNIWLGMGGGAVRYNGKNFEYYSEKQGNISNDVNVIFEDSRGYLWIGTSKGLCSFYQNTFYHYTTEEGLASNYINFIIEDREGSLWIGSNGGINVFSYENDQETISLLTEAEGLASNEVRTILEDRKGHIWIGSKKALSCYQKENNQASITHYTTNEGLSTNDIRTVLEDTKGQIWFGTIGNGLHFFNPKSDSLNFNQIKIKDGLSDNLIWSIKEDKLGRIWVSTEKGISLITPYPDERGKDKNPGKLFGQIFTFQKEEGLKALDFQLNSVLLDSKNRLWWGAKGLMVLNLNEFELWENPPRSVQISHVEINQEFIDYRKLSQEDYKKELVIGNELAKSFESTAAFRNYPENLKLPYHLNQLTFHFSAINWNAPRKINYQYQMIGMDNGWSKASTSSSADYRNLPYGKHTFQLRSCGEVGSCSEPIAYSFEILPPWWHTRWAYFAYFLIFSGIFYGIFSFFRHRWELQAALEKEQEEASRLKELDKLKNRFFINVSHELRTPLSLISGPMSTLLKSSQLDEKQAKLLKLASQGTGHLKQMVTEILDLGKLDMGKMVLTPEPTEFTTFFSRYLTQFESLAAQKQIDYQIDIQSPKGIGGEIDREKCRQIIYNLLSNAFKFTPKFGQISVHLLFKENRLNFMVADSGPGIHPEDLPYIFDRYFQTNQTNRSAEGGSGIGLALCEGYAKLFNGQISVDSTLGKGSIFKLSFPVESIAIAAEVGFKEREREKERRVDLEEENLGVKPVLKAIQTIKNDEASLSPLVQEDAIAVVSESKPTILVVEDNLDLQEYISIVLEGHYEVKTAENGQEALNYLANNGNCQLILSDLMMPVMDGFQLLQRLKSNSDTWHIPTIMLTARADTKDKLKALRIGVDDYLIKPFIEEELLVRIENLLVNQAFRNGNSLDDHDLEPENLTISDADREWLETFENYVQLHYADSILSVNVLANQFAMSESTLLRQLKRLTGLTPAKYLQEVRLSQARQILENKKYNSISKVAEEVGYSDVRSFSRSFKKRFGKSPSEM